MSRAVELSETAEKALKQLPRDRQIQVERAIDRWNYWQGRLRRRAGDYRTIFTVDHGTGRVGISAILTRSEKTYR